LPRRANHLHKFNIENSSPRRETGRGLFQSDGDPHSGRTIFPSNQASQSALPPEPFQILPVRANVPARGVATPRPHRGPVATIRKRIASGGIGFAPETIATAVCRTFY
jgi:hypothetical protein